MRFFEKFKYRCVHVGKYEEIIGGNLFSVAYYSLHENGWGWRKMKVWGDMDCYKYHTHYRRCIDPWLRGFIDVWWASEQMNIAENVKS
jgi:hypothetical protein